MACCSKKTHPEQIVGKCLRGNFLLPGSALKGSTGQAKPRVESGFAATALDTRDNTMKLRTITAAGLAIGLAGCTTIPSAGNPIEARWVGKSAGIFFAAYGPPISDSEQGATTVYTWRGGYKTVRIPAKYAEGADGKRGKQIASARTAYLRCQAEITTSSDYTIRDIRTVADIPGVDGPSYCAEFLAPEQK